VNDNLAGSRLGIRDFFQAQNLRPAKLVHTNRFHLSSTFRKSRLAAGSDASPA
jgi:hypothetical protein